MLSNQTKRELANKLIKYLTDKYCQPNTNVIPVWDNTSKMIHEASEVLNEQPFDIWKVYDLLRVLGRIELNNPNGRKGGRLINNTPVELPLNINKKCDSKRCPLVKAMFRTFPELNHSKDK